MIIVISDGQSVFDIAAQYYGSTDQVWTVLEDNLMNLDINLKSGDKVYIRDSGLTSTVYKYLKINNYLINNSDNQEIEDQIEVLSARVIEIKNEDAISLGYILIEVFGGKKPYSFSWSNGQTGQNLVGAPAGTYSVVITDSNGTIITLSNLVVSVKQQSYLVDENGNPVIDEFGSYIVIEG
jgi:hypothetical protein